MDKDHRYWIDQIESARGERDFKAWLERAEKVVKIYEGVDDNYAKAFPVLWANVQTTGPSLYSSVPKPEITNRFYKNNPLAQAVAKVLERSISYSVDFMNFDSIGERVVCDYLVPGRATLRVRYKPYLGEGDPVRHQVEQGFVNGRPVGDDDDVQLDANGPFIVEPGPERIVYQEVTPEYVHWRDFLTGPAKEWRLVPWVAFRHRFNKDEILQNYGGTAAATIAYDEDEQDGDDPRATCWEIWDKIGRQVLVVTEGYNDFLEREDDPLELVDFFPCPEPACAVVRSGSMVPIPEYTQYQHLADEVDELTRRIQSIASAIKARGAYPSNMSGLLDLLADDDQAKLVPVEDWTSFAEKGGLAGIVDWMPTEPLANTLVVLVRERANTLQTIYEITGISDLMRGQTNPRETARGQNLKAQFGTRRMTPKQRAIARLFRDTYRIMAEIMAEHFEPQTFTAMAGVQVTKEHTELMNNDVLRTFAIDIETDSTIAADEQQDKADVIEFFGAMGQMLQGLAPLIDQGAMPFEAGKAMILEGAKRFRFGRDTQAMLESMQAPQPKPDPMQDAKIADMQRKAEEGKMREKSRERKTDQDVRESKTREGKIAAETLKTVAEAVTDEPEKSDGAQ